MNSGSTEDQKTHFSPIEEEDGWLWVQFVI